MSVLFQPQPIPKQSVLGIVPLSIALLVSLFSHIRMQAFYITKCVSSVQTDGATLSNVRTCNFDSDGVLMRVRPLHNPGSAVTIAQFHGYQAGHTSAPPAFYEQADLVFHCYPRNTDMQQVFPDATGLVYFIPPLIPGVPVIFYIRDGPADPVSAVHPLV